MKFPESSFYSFGYPHLRFVDYTDGYVWTGPIDRQPRVTLIPLSESSPADQKNPDAVRRWKDEAASLADPLGRPGMQSVRAWREACRGSAP
jgi:hypothetical protein